MSTTMNLPLLNKDVRGVVSPKSCWSFRGDGIGIGAQWSLVLVDAAWVTERLPGEAGINKIDKALQVREWLAKNDEVWAPVVRLVNDGERLCIEDGTHTLDTLLKLGVTKVALVVPASQAPVFMGAKDGQGA